MKESREHIKSLLDKFVDGQTTESEEATLAEYFETAENVPDEWQAYKEMFQSFKTDCYDFSEDEVADILTPQIDRRAHTGRRVFVACAAACVAIAVGVFIMHPWNNNTSVIPKTYPTDATVAQADTNTDTCNVFVASSNDTGTPITAREKNTAYNKTKRKKADRPANNVVKSIDNMIASVTRQDEQVESYEIRNVGDANIVTKRFDDGTSASYIVACSDNNSDNLLIAFSENN